MPGSQKASPARFAAQNMMCFWLLLLLLLLIYLIYLY
jgi:hypothetical protein